MQNYAFQNNEMKFLQVRGNALGETIKQMQRKQNYLGVEYGNKKKIEKKTNDKIP